jgi:hypothetical protein
MKKQIYQKSKNTTEITKKIQQTSTLMDLENITYIES